MALQGAIQSRHNPNVRYVRQLHKRRARHTERRYLIEGHRLVDQALLSGIEPVFAFYTETYAQTPEGTNVVASLERLPTPTWSASPEAMAHMADTVSPQGILAVVPIPPVQPADCVPKANLIVMLDRLRDPGNVGTIMRTCQATDVDLILLSKGCADAYSPKVVRSAMGAHFALPILQGLLWRELRPLLARKRVAVADAAGSHSLWELDWTGSSVLVVGSEAHGPSQFALEAATDTVRLPMSPGIESLNAAVAGSVILFEIYRQRHTAE